MPKLELPTNDSQKLTDIQPILMYPSVVKVKKNRGLEFSKSSFKVVSAYLLLQSSDIKTHGSESRSQEEAGLRDERVSYLQVALL